MACRLVGAKPLSEPMLEYCWYWPLGTNFNEISVNICTFSFKKIHFKISSGKWHPFSLGLSMLKQLSPKVLLQIVHISQLLYGLEDLYLNLSMQSHCHFADEIFKCIFRKENFCMLIQASLNFFLKCPSDNKFPQLCLLSCSTPSHYLLNDAQLIGTSLPASMINTGCNLYFILLHYTRKWHHTAVARSTNDFLLKFEILWKLQIVSLSISKRLSLQNFAHAKTAQLSWHVQNFVVIICSSIIFKQNFVSNLEFLSGMSAIQWVMSISGGWD